MDRQNLEPLHPEAWLDACRRFHYSLQHAPAEDQAQNIRRLFHLLRLAPVPLRDLFTPSISEKLFEQILAECQLLASISLINPSLSVTLDKNVNEPDVKLSLTYPGSTEIITTEHPHLPVAVMTGISTLALTLANE